MPRRTVIWSSFIALMVIALAITGYFVLFRGHDPSNRNNPGIPATQPVQQVPAADIQILQNALNSSQKDSQASAFAAQPHQVFAGQTQFLLPPGQQVQLDPATSAVSGNDGRVDAAILACDPNHKCTPTGAHYTLRLIRESNHQWRILYIDGR